MDENRRPKPKAGGVHAGHRHRMRQRFIATGLESFQDHEALEFLLYYAIPRRDVNETAHLLLERFGTLAGVLDATPEQLQAVPGVGPGTANFLSLMPEIGRQMAIRFQNRTPTPMETPQDVADYLARRLRVPLAPGQVLLVLTNHVNHILAVHRFDRFEALNIRDVTLKTTGAGAGRCILIERVPDNTALPAPGRLEALNDLSEKLHLQQCPLWDYFAVDDLGHAPSSYARSGRLLPRQAPVWDKITGGC